MPWDLDPREASAVSMGEVDAATAVDAEWVTFI